MLFRSSFHYEPRLCTCVNGMLLDTPRDMPSPTPMIIKPKEASQEVHGAKASRQEAWKRRRKKKASASISAEQTGAAEPVRSPPNHPCAPPKQSSGYQFGVSPSRTGAPEPARRGGRRRRTTSAWSLAPPELTAGTTWVRGNLGLMPLEMPFRPFLYK